MIPAAILLIFLVLADVISHVVLWFRLMDSEEQLEDAVKDIKTYAKEYIDKQIGEEIDLLKKTVDLRVGKLVVDAVEDRFKKV